MLIKQIGFVVQITFFFLVKLTRAVFSDEAYEKDWHLESVGNGIKHVLPFKNGTELVVLSNDNILSYLDSTNGDILHRQEVVSQDNEVAYKYLNDELVVYNILNNQVEKVIDLETGLEKSFSTETFGISSYNSFEPSNLAKVSLAFDESISQYILQVQDLNSNLGLLTFKVKEGLFPTDFNPDFEVNYVSSDPENKKFVFIITDSSTQVIYFLEFVNNNIKAFWKRDNSVADIVAFTIIDPKLNVESLPRDFFTNTTASNINEVFANYVNRVSNSLHLIKNYVFVEKKLKWSSFVLDLFTEDKSASIIASRDLQFGFTKYLIAANGNGLLSCIDMNTGVIVWKFKPGFESKVKGLLSDLENELSVITESGELYKYDISDLVNPPLILTKHALRPNAGVQVKKVDNLGAENVLIEYSNEEEEIVSSIAEYKPNDEDVIIKFDSVNNKIVSYSAESLTKVWSYSVDGNSRIITFANKHFDEKSSNVAITYGKKSLFKFLYHNLLAVASYDKDSKFLSIDILDSKTGTFVKSIDLNEEETIDLQSPINLLLGEHWLVVSYKALKPVPEQKIAVIEFYEQESEVESNKKSDANDHIPEPVFSLNSYIFPEVISSLALTKTKYGVSSKNIVAKLANGQITTIPKFILNSRRKAESEMTPEEKLEPFMQPYYQVIPMNNQFVLSHERNLLSFDEDNVFSIATNMESTTYICDLNRVDLFCTKFAPSGEFDILQANFQRNQILFTITVLAVALYVVQPMIKKRQLKLKYYIN